MGLPERNLPTHVRACAVGITTSVSRIRAALVTDALGSKPLPGLEPDTVSWSPGREQDWQGQLTAPRRNTCGP